MEMVPPALYLGDIMTNECGEKGCAIEVGGHLYQKGPRYMTYQIRQHCIPHTQMKPCFNPGPLQSPPAIFNEVRQHLKEMPECGAIRPFNSSYSPSVVLMKKKDSSLRLCFDLRYMHSCTPADAYLVPHTEESLGVKSLVIK